MSDLCVTRENSAAWEGESVHLAANHNVQAYVRAMRAAYDVYMGADQRPVPTDIQAIREMIKLVFEQGNPRELIEEYRPWLDGYAVTLEEE